MKMNTVSSQGNSCSTHAVSLHYKKWSSLPCHHPLLPLFCTTVFVLYFLLFFFLTASGSVWDVKFPCQGLNLCPLQWKHGVLTTEQPGWSPCCTFNFLRAVITIFFSVAEDFGFALLYFQDGLETWVNL